MPTKEELEARIADLQAQNTLLKEVFSQEHDRANECQEVAKQKAKGLKEWRELAEHRAKTIKDLQAELSYYIRKNPNLTRNWNNLQKYKVMSEWFDEYQAEGKKVGEAYKLIYDRAVEAKLIGEIIHYNVDPNSEDGKADHDEQVQRKVRRCLDTYRDRHKKAIEDRVKRHRELFHPE